MDHTITHSNDESFYNMLQSITQETPNGGSNSAPTVANSSRMCGHVVTNHQPQQQQQQGHHSHLNIHLHHNNPFQPSLKSEYSSPGVVGVPNVVDDELVQLLDPAKDDVLSWPHPTTTTATASNGASTPPTTISSGNNSTDLHSSSGAPQMIPFSHPRFVNCKVEYQDNQCLLTSCQVNESIYRGIMLPPQLLDQLCATGMLDLESLNVLRSFAAFSQQQQQQQQQHQQHQLLLDNVVMGGTQPYEAVVASARSPSLMIQIAPQHQQHHHHTSPVITAQQPISPQEGADQQQQYESSPNTSHSSSRSASPVNNDNSPQLSASQAKKAIVLEQLDKRNKKKIGKKRKYVKSGLYRKDRNGNFIFSSSDRARLAGMIDKTEGESPITPLDGMPFSEQEQSEQQQPEHPQLEQQPQQQEQLVDPISQPVQLLPQQQQQQQLQLQLPQQQQQQQQMLGHAPIPAPLCPVVEPFVQSPDFLLFCREQRALLSSGFEEQNTEAVDSLLVEQWKVLPAAEKKRYQFLAHKEPQADAQQDVQDVQNTQRVKRPLNAYNIFCKMHFEEVKEKNPNMSINELSKLMGEKWKQMTDQEKKQYYDKVEHGQPRYKKPLNSYNLFCKKNFEALKKQYPNHSINVLSKIMGEKWKKLPAVEKQKYVEKAKQISEAQNVMDLQQSQDRSPFDTADSVQQQQQQLHHHQQQQQHQQHMHQQQHTLPHQQQQQYCPTTDHHHALITGQQAMHMHNSPYPSHLGFFHHAPQHHHHHQTPHSPFTPHQQPHTPMSDMSYAGHHQSYPSMMLQQPSPPQMQQQQQQQQQQSTYNHFFSPMELHSSDFFS